MGASENTNNSTIIITYLYAVGNIVAIMRANGVLAWK
jgi:hypothetical protein